MVWHALDAVYGVHRLGARFPRRALREARAHRLDSDDATRRAAVAADEGTYWVFDFRGRGPWDEVYVHYVCVEPLGAQGSGTTFQATYWSMDWSTQWVHMHWSVRRRCWRASNTEFTIFPC